MLVLILKYSTVLLLFSRIIAGRAQHPRDIERQQKSLQMQRYCNPKSDPCEDFYEFACGNYGRYHSTNSSTSVLDDLEEAMKSKIHLALAIDNAADTAYDRKVKIFNRSCLKADQLKPVYEDKLREVIREFGQMPVLEGEHWRESDFDWRQSLAAIFHKTGKGIIFSLEAFADEGLEVVKKLAQCFHDQYQGYAFGGRPLPEVESQTENIADNGGLHLVYHSYLEWYDRADARTRDLESLAGFNYTHRQLFFISYAQCLCATTQPDYMSAHAAGDIHVPEKFRVIGALSNLPEFAQEFNCPRGSAMNPVNKCEIY